MTDPTSTTCDSSVLVAAFLGWHEHHVAAMRAVRDDVDATPAHALAEVFSVLTRLPAPHRVTPAAAVQLLTRLQAPVISLAADRVLPTVELLATRGIGGGAIYDGLIAATAVEHNRVLTTLDRRAARTYATVGASVRFLA